MEQRERESLERERVSWAVVWAAWGSVGMVRRGLRGGRSERGRAGGEYRRWNNGSGSPRGIRRLRVNVSWTVVWAAWGMSLQE